MKRLLISTLLIILIPCLLMTPELVFGYDMVDSAKADLNGDGKMEEIAISKHGLYGGFILNVDKISIIGQLEDDIDGFVIVDIDTVDKYKEIAVHTPGPSGDDQYLIYNYDGKTVKEMGKLERWPKFFGDGTVIVQDWMGFWSKKDKYVLNKERRALDLIPQELYNVGIEAEVIESFPLYKSRQDTTIVDILKPNSKVLVLLCDPSPEHCKEHLKEISDNFFCDWYLIKSENEIVGWARMKSFSHKLALSWAD